ncbi:MULTISPECIES: hypothetical protein [unclassified Modicisalibacter]|uniref:hypothetical protein n=1 Tax=unclassified Modicisalibacter TaxID=2679913 RepID=UPI001CCD6011|nr:MULTISPECIES: hypothetical protein [unclassified Modicisalibacter]MBZ9558336.1 hypothetical protein [Modicisalibacter sp. R2A 31.J]MBZ9575772.1 hypothetical protein [Modicisalibacter sp. MOD 31.J]
MRVETLGDVLDWTQRTHANLADCLAQCSRQTHRERLKMLLDYLVEHERQLSHALELARHDAMPSALNTWCYEYFENAPARPERQCQANFRDMDVDEVMAAVLAFHEQVTGLYRHLLDQDADVPSARELLENLLSLEEHEAMRLARDAGRMKDL